MRYFYYKMMVDSGGAPCVYRNILTLAICKPSIRATAQIGDWIYGFGARSTLGERLIYVAEVKDTIINGMYYRKKRYWARPDCIYRWSGNALKWKSGSTFHIGGNKRDVGLPPHSKARVLLSVNFRYLGESGTESYKSAYPVIARAVSRLTQGHRVNHPKNLEEELAELRLQCWNDYPKKKKLGRPSDADRSAKCDRSEGEARKLQCAEVG
jgi:hypothetical protein